MFERFDDQARRAVVLAQEQLRVLQHQEVGSVHLLLGVLDLGDGPAHALLKALDVDPERVRAEALLRVPPGRHAPSGHVPFTKNAKGALEKALRVAQDLGDTWIGADHLLLGLLRQSRSTAADVLAGLGVTATRAEQAARALPRAPVESDRTVAATARPAGRDTLAELTATVDALSARVEALERRSAD